MNRAWIGCVLIAVLASAADADIEPGVDWYFKNAAVVFEVHKPTPPEAKALPDDLRESLIVDHVLKGFDTRRYITGMQASLFSGSRALLLESFTDFKRSTYDFPLHEDATIQLWPVTDAGVDTKNVPLETGGGFGRPPVPPLPLDAIRACMAGAAPEEASLQSQMLDALLFPDRFAALSKKDPARATYLRLALTIRDAPRDVPLLMNLLESPDAETRHAVAKYLESITHAGIGLPAKDDLVALHDHFRVWRLWWTIHASDLVWHEDKFAFSERQRSDLPAYVWPAIPPADNNADRTDPLIQRAIDLLQPKNGPIDAAAFGPVFRAFIDGSNIRDRYLRAAMRPQPGAANPTPEAQQPAWLRKLRTERSASSWIEDREPAAAVLINASGLENFCGTQGPYLPPAPRLRQDLLLNQEIPAPERFRLAALYMFYFHSEQISMERGAAAVKLSGKNADMENVRRAVYWGAGSGDEVTQAAIKRLGESADAPDQKKLALVFLEHPTSPGNLEAARTAIDAGHKQFIEQLMGCLRTGSGPSFQWSARVMTQQHQKQAIPVLAARLKDKDDSVRYDAAFALCWLPTHDAVPALLDALHIEKDPKAKQQILTALCQTDDPRALDDLLIAATTGPRTELDGQICRGLARIGDPKALPVVAKLALYHESDKRNITFCDAVSAFGYISKLYKSPPGRFFESSNFGQNESHAALPVLQKWLKDHPDSPAEQQAPTTAPATAPSPH